MREVLADTKSAAGDSCGVVLRFAADELMGDLVFTSIGEGRDLIEMLAEQPDRWDVNLSAWENDSAASRFKRSGYRDGYVSFVNEVTTKPVVGVGHFTSPDAMATLIKKERLDMIGAAHPSIADPFLPKRLRKAGSTTSASASAAIPACRATPIFCPSAALRSRP